MARKLEKYIKVQTDGVHYYVTATCRTGTAVVAPPTLNDAGEAVDCEPLFSRREDAVDWAQNVSKLFKMKYVETSV